MVVKCQEQSAHCWSCQHGSGREKKERQAAAGWERMMPAATADVVVAVMVVQAAVTKHI
jgi:hypothetical protein